MEPAMRAQSVHALRSLPPTAVARGPGVDHAISAARLCKSSSRSRRPGASDAGTIGVRAKGHATDALQRKVCDAMLRGCASSSRSWRREASDAAGFVRAKEHATDALQRKVYGAMLRAVQAAVGAGDLEPAMRHVSCALKSMLPVNGQSCYAANALCKQ